jgi:hypothetical protein
MRITLGKVIFTIVSYALIMALIFLVIGKYLDLKVESYLIDATRHSINLLQLILTGSGGNCIAKNDVDCASFVDASGRLDDMGCDEAECCEVYSGMCVDICYLYPDVCNSGCCEQRPNTGSPIAKEKLILDSNKLDEYLDGSVKEEWEDCCEPLEYDYNLFVYDLENGNKWKTGKLIFDNICPIDECPAAAECYLDYQKMKNHAEMPVSIYYEDHTYHPGIANLTLMRTPLSELIFWISQTSVRVGEEMDRMVIKSIVMGPEIGLIDIEKKSGTIKVCMEVRGSKVCKSFGYGAGDPQINICHEGSADCDDMTYSECNESNLCEWVCIPHEECQCVSKPKCGSLGESKKVTLPENCNVITVRGDLDRNEINITIPVSS